MDEKSMLLIINPASGVNSKADFAEQLQWRLGQIGYHVDTVYTQRRGHATELARRAVDDGYRHVTVCGGDGTVNETATALCGTGVVLGIIPSGSGNGLARHLDIPVDELRSLDAIAEGNIVDCDCGEVNGKRFFCTCGMGFDASVSQRFSFEKRRGRITYIKNIIEEFGKYKPQRYTLEIDGQTIEREALIVACCNASQYGNNAFIAPQASITDGMLDIVVIKSGNALSMMLAGFDVMAGMVPYNNHIETFRVRQASISLDHPVWAHIDGEPVMCGGNASVRCIPAQLKVFSPADKKPFRPFITPIDLTLRDWGIAIGKILGK